MTAPDAKAPRGFGSGIPVVDRSADVLVQIGRRVPAFGHALQLQSKRDFAGARREFQRLADRPDLTAACLHQLGVLAAFEGDNARAAQLFEHALRLEPGEPLYHCSLGTVLERMGDLPRAIAAMVNLAIMLQGHGNHADALPLYQRVLQLDPLHYAAWANMGTGLAWLDRPREAVAPLLVAVVLYGRVLPEARLLADRLIAVLADQRPDDLAPALARLPDGLPTGRLEKLEDVLQTLDKALRVAGFHEATGLALEAALDLSPGSALARWNHALDRLARGDFAAGWRDYEWRWVWPQFPETRRVLPAPRWRGEELAGKRIYVWGEQGYGDILQFAPLALRLAAQAAEVVLEVTTPLVRLLARVLDRPGLRVVARPDQPHQLALDEPFDYAVPLMSLPHFMGLRLEDLPLEPGWLAVPPDLVEAAHPLLPPADGRRRVGVVWAGRPQHADDARRSLPQALIGPLLDTMPDAQWISLQVGPRAADATAHRVRLHDTSAALGDFADTAGLIAHLDHVVAVDTGVAHLAAAMGKTVSLLLPHAVDWRWGLADTRSPWYPGHRLYRQPSPGDWAAVLEALRWDWHLRKAAE